MLPSRALALALAGLMAVAGLVLIAPAAADTPDATIIELPDGMRAIPRGVWPIGQTDDGHTVLVTEQDPFSSGGGFGSNRIVSADGTVEDLDSSVESVVGDRLVASHTDTSVRSRLVTALSWTTQTVPAGYTVMDYTADGIVVRSGSAGAHQLGLIAWGSDTVLAITGVPAGSSVYPYFHAVEDNSWSVLSAGFSGGGTGKLVVDTGARRAWPMQASAGDCPATGGSGMAVNEGVLAWYTQLADQSYVVCTTQLPAPDDAQVAATTERSMTMLPPELGHDYELLPVGSDVLLSVADAKRTWGTDVGEPVLAIAPDGTARELAHSGHGVVAGAEGHVLVVTGGQPGEASLRDMTVATGTSVEAMPIQPVGAWYSSIAVDGTTVVYSDDSAAFGGARRRTVDFGAGTAGPDTLLDSDVTGPVATGGAVAAWGKSGYQGIWSSVLNADNTRTSGNAYKPRWAEPGWVRFQGEVMRLPSGTRSSLADTAAFQDGVSYTPGGNGAAANAVVATDLVTGATSTITVPECTSVGNVQVAGSWLLVVCPVDATHLKSVVVDRTGTVATHVLGPSNSYYLGNGFALARGAGDSLSWASLSDATVTWKTLGTATADGDDAPYSVAASRGATPTAAWFSGRSAHVALLPVATSPLPAHPDTFAAPPVPTSLQVTIDPASGEATVSWSWTAAAGAEQAQSFDVAAGDIHVDGLAASVRSTSLGVPPAGSRPVQVVVHGPTQSSTAQLSSVHFTGPPVTPTISSIAPPAISGTPRIGSPLTASPGTWSPSDGSYAYQWLANGTPITGATAATYTPTLAVFFEHLTVRVTASKAGYKPASALSAPTAAVGLGPVININPPSISGIRRTGHTLTAIAGTWSPGNLSFRYTWLRDGRVITGAHDRTYKLTSASTGHRISVRVKATRPGYTAAVSTSHRTVRIP